MSKKGHLNKSRHLLLLLPLLLLLLLLLVLRPLAPFHCLPMIVFFSNSLLFVPFAYLKWSSREPPRIRRRILYRYLKGCVASLRE
jgi:hypothetical protein